MTHTKGPWQVGEYRPMTGRVEIETVERGRDCPQFGNIIGWVLAADRDDADARLIAAAPDLLSVCEALLDNIDKGFSVITFTGNDGLTNKGDTGNLESMRAAINKARGIK